MVVQQLYLQKLLHPPHTQCMQCTCTHTPHTDPSNTGRRRKTIHCVQIFAASKRGERFCELVLRSLLLDDDDDELKTFKSSKPKTKRCPKKEKRKSNMMNGFKSLRLVLSLTNVVWARYFPCIQHAANLFDFFNSPILYPKNQKKKDILCIKSNHVSNLFFVSNHQIHFRNQHRI